MNKNTFIDNESFNNINYEMFNTRYQEIRMQSVTVAEVPLAKK